MSRYTLIGLVFIILLNWLDIISDTTFYVLFGIGVFYSIANEYERKHNEIIGKIDDLEYKLDKRFDISDYDKTL